ncbi:MAG TPA: hypothetical protein VK789_01105 [Bryobacteraceae bacterium]|jgi:hypothetical protein|nr:hypothetical protein [Bryobacteraceae bacterium]
MSGCVYPANTIPAHLAAEVRRVAKRNYLTMSKAPVTLAEKGVEAKASAREELYSAYRRFMTEGDAESKAEAGRT